MVLSGYVCRLRNIRLYSPSEKETETKQDPVTARFSTCALPWINAISAIIAALILVIYVLRLLVPLQAKWPRPFVEEYEVPYKHMVANDRPHVQTSLIFLILYCLAGLGLSVAQIWHPCFRLLNVFPALSWVFLTVYRTRPTLTAFNRQWLQLLLWFFAPERHRSLF